MKRLRTIKDLAELAEVSTGTVSRALAGSKLISTRTRERIQALAEEHKFKPNLLARSLRMQRTSAIGVLIPVDAGTTDTTSDPSLGAVLCLLAEAFAARGYDMLLRPVPTASSNWLADYVESGRVDGVILLGEGGAREAIDAVAATFLPIVAWGAREEGRHHCTVGSDYVAGGKLAAEHLLARGCRNVAFFGDETVPETAQRLAGLRAAVEAAGGNVRTVAIGGTAFGDLTRVVAGLDERPLPDAIVAGSDALAMRILAILLDRKVAVPETVKVIGFGGMVLGADAVPPLTTIRPDYEGISNALIDTLLRRVAGEDAPPVTLPPTLIQRGST